jgi:hypothetical protein
LKTISASLKKKSGIKIEGKVYESVGRLKQKYPSTSRYFYIDYTVDTDFVKKHKDKRNDRGSQGEVDELENQTGP